MTTLSGHRGGETFSNHRDRNRLNRQAVAVFNLMIDGYWRTLSEIASHTGEMPTSVSARLRDLRKPRFGGYIVDREHVGDGIWRYRVRRPS